MTTVYFIRHAQSDNSIRDGRIRPLTEKGMNDCALVTEFLQNKDIDVVLSSPYKRAIDTIADFTKKNGLSVLSVEGFKEHDTISDNYPDNDYYPFIKNYWEDYHNKVSGDESLFEVQCRNITALNEALVKYNGKNIVIGTHGMALSTIINYYDQTYGFEDFIRMVKIKPWVVRMDFNDDGCIGMEKIDLFNPGQKPDYDKCIVRTAESGTLKAYRFTVIFARYQDKWLYCRAKERDVFETAGGRVEPGESPLEGAKRELYEETGAVKYKISPAFDYSVHVQTGYSNGQVYIAQIQELGDMPGFEMAEVKLFDTIPDKMRFPMVLPVLFERVKALL